MPSLQSQILDLRSELRGKLPMAWEAKVPQPGTPGSMTQAEAVAILQQVTLGLYEMQVALTRVSRACATYTLVTAQSKTVFDDIARLTQIAQAVLK
jgi:hypothetical protein